MGLFDFLKRSKPTQAVEKQSSFKENVAAFWAWYQTNAERFHEKVDTGKSSELVSEVSNATNEWLAGLGWVFGPGPNGEGHSFTLTPEGDPHNCFLAEYWRKAAPEIPGWTFYSSRQPSNGDLSGQTIKIRDEIFKPEAFWITPEIDIENECIHIHAWHPLFEHLEQNQQYEILFLWLDEILGERGTADRIGSITLDNTKLKEAFPILELGEFVKKHSLANEWKSYEPGTAYTGYKMNDPSEDFLRADIFTGTTTHLRLAEDYFTANGKMEDPLDGTGASFLFLAFDNAYLPEGKEVDTRADIEDALNANLSTENSGICLGGATGTQNVYIDLLIFDGDRSLKIIVDTLNTFNLPKGSALYPFAGHADVPLHVF